MPVLQEVQFLDAPTQFKHPVGSQDRQTVPVASTKYSEPQSETQTELLAYRLLRQVRQAVWLVQVLQGETQALQILVSL